MGKYKEEKVKDKSLPFQGGILYELREILFFDADIKPVTINVGKGFHQDVITKEALIKFGQYILEESLSSDAGLFKLGIPSEKYMMTGHSVALMVDFKNKSMDYQNSYGKDHREIRDFLTALFPDYRYSYHTEVQQENDTDALTDGSCMLLSEYNLRDMLYRREGHPELARGFNTEKARNDAWEKLKNIPDEYVSAQIGKYKEALSERHERGGATPEERKRFSEANFRYRMHKEPTYERDIKEAAETARANFEKERKELLAKTINR